MKWTEGNIEGVEVREPVRHADSRGWLIEIFRSDEMNTELTPKMGYMSATHPGVARGPHEHRDQTDSFAFLGPGLFKVNMWDHRTASSTCGRKMTFVAGEGRPAVVTVPPGVVHGYRNVSAVDGWVVNFPNRLYAGTGKKSPVDEVRHEDGSNSDFQMD